MERSEVQIKIIFWESKIVRGCSKTIDRIVSYDSAERTVFNVLLWLNQKQRYRRKQDLVIFGH